MRGRTLITVFRAPGRGTNQLQLAEKRGHGMVTLVPRPIEAFEAPRVKPCTQVKGWRLPAASYGQ